MQCSVPIPSELSLSNFCMKSFKRLQTGMLRNYVRQLGGSDQGSKKTILTEIKKIIHKRHCGQAIAVREKGEEIRVCGSTPFRVTSTWSKRTMRTVLSGDQLKRLAAEIPLDSYIKSVVYVSR